MKKYNHKKKFERKHGISLGTVEAVLFQKQLDYGVIQTVYGTEEEGHQLLVSKDFFALSIETRRFLVLTEVMAHTSFLESQREEMSRLELAIETDWMAGLQLDCFNPAKPAIRALEELSQLNLGTEEQLDISDRLTNLRPELLSESEVIDLIHQVFNDDSHSDDAYEASWNGAED